MNIQNEFGYFAIKERQKSMLRHYKRLQQIRNNEPKKSITNMQTAKRCRPYSEIERKMEIERSNKVLLEKLIDINQRKKSAEALTRSMFNLKSLNQSIRKKAAEKINNENEVYSKRILMQKPLILKKDFDKNFAAYKKYCEQLSKKHLIKFREEFIQLPGINAKKIRAKSPNFCKSIKKIVKHKSDTPKLNADYKEKRDFLIEDDSSYEDDFYN